MIVVPGLDSECIPHVHTHVRMTGQHVLVKIVFLSI